MQKPALKEIFSLLEQYGVNNVICSPGSRNAAILAEADASPNMRNLVVVDERSAAFIALGQALITRRPVALICTSGSALLNYGPAIAEAYYQGLPLIVLSADRPSEWIDQDDSQTIRQFGAISNLVKAEYDIDGDKNDSDYLWYVNRIVNEGLSRALSRKQGPVHFNIHLDGKAFDSKNTGYRARKVDTVIPPQLLAKEQIRMLADEAKDLKIMVVAGFMTPDNNLQKAITSLATLPNVVIMAETVSNLHLGDDCFMVDTVLFPLSDARMRELAPDLVISLGGALISRKLKEFLRRCHPGQHWSFSYSDNLIDCFKALTTKFECNPSSFLKSLAKRIAKHHKENTSECGSSYRESWNALRKKVKPERIGMLPWCDLKALSLVLNSLPEDTNLFLSNGTTVRYGQIIPYPKTHATYSNRGVSGIEGSTSTAIGAALVYDKTTCLITGDMSFGYDLGGLASRLAPDTLRIIVLDNKGGEIFRFINATKNLQTRERYLSADQEVPVNTLAEAFGFEYFHADSEEALNDTFEEFFSDSFVPRILHISTRNVKDNSEFLRKYLIDNELAKD